MNRPAAEFDTINRQFMSFERPKKPKMLVVDDEPDNLDLLYRTFRRDFNVLRAESGVVALEMLASEGEVAVIISDQRMPEMKGTEFLSKTVPQFPDTMRIILTGFTDVEDLVEAINSGQVYKYITKPWDPNELKAVVQRAVETYDLLKQRTEELRRAHAQTTLLETIVQAGYEAENLDACLQQIAIAYGQTFSADGCILQLLEGESLGRQSIYGIKGELANWLAEDPLVQDAISTKTIKVAMNVSGDADLEKVQHYAENGIQAHLVVPIPFHEAVLAVLSLQWKQPQVLAEDELNVIHLSSRQVGMVLTCTQARLAMV
ncbi:two-component system response regulator [filamentous cyanobacterium CCP1]|nr:two-component system response regulator [filamentous cyanobacterium CCP2]PSB60855.1 two-component system response regulator [filamentous cyanobacterium CCP1]